jgi:hypothetical protein
MAQFYSAPWPLIAPPLTFGTSVCVHLGGVDEHHAEIETEFQRCYLVGPPGAILAHPICAQTERR